MITAAVLIKGNPINLTKTFMSINFCKEIIVVDDKMSNEARTIANKYNARILKSPNGEGFSEKRNLALKESQNDWILFIDSDEVVSKDLKKNILKGVNDTKFAGFYLKRQDHFWGRKLRWGELWTQYSVGIIRLVKKGVGHWEGDVHEKFETSLKIGSLNGFIVHSPHPSLKEFLLSINEYSTIRARGLVRKNYNSNFILIFAFPFLKFIQTYFLYFGFLDGVPGFTYSFMMSFHSFLVRSKVFLYKKS